MHFEEGHIYHVYNRSNETVYYSRDNYLFFIEKTRRLIYPVSEILSYCLMPNHFHFIIQANEKSIKPCGENHRPKLQTLSKNLGTLLSSYTQAINKRQNRKGKLFAHNTQAKLITHKGGNYLSSCILYIHQNPIRAGIAANIENWDYSSAQDFAGIRSVKLCNMKLVQKMLNVDELHALSGSNR